MKLIERDYLKTVCYGFKSHLRDLSHYGVDQLADQPSPEVLFLTPCFILELDDLMI